MHLFKGEHGHRTAGVPSRKLWAALHEVDRYLNSQSNWPVNYAKRYRAGLRVGTSVTEGTPNFLVNRRTNKSQQMRWSRRGADLLLQVRCAVYNGVLGSGLGQLFEPVLAQTHNWQRRRDPPSFWTLPRVVDRKERTAQSLRHPSSLVPDHHEGCCLTATLCPGNRVRYSLNGFFAEPQGDAASPDQCGVVFRPVRHAVFCFRDFVATTSIGFYGMALPDAVAHILYQFP